MVKAFGWLDPNFSGTKKTFFVFTSSFSVSLEAIPGNRASSSLVKAVNIRIMVNGIWVDCRFLEASG